jgi:hypothetical protein
VVGAFELGDFVPAGEGAGRFHGEHDRFTAGIAEAHLLDVGNARNQQLGQFDVLGGGHGEGGAESDLSLDCGRHLRIGMAEDERRVVIKEVDALVALDVGHTAAAATGGINRIRGERDGVPRVSTGHDAGGAVRELLREGLFGLVGGGLGRGVFRGNRGRGGLPVHVSVGAVERT